MYVKIIFKKIIQIYAYCQLYTITIYYYIIAEYHPIIPTYR